VRGLKAKGYAEREDNRENGCRRKAANFLRKNHPFSENRAIMILIGGDAHVCYQV